MITRNTEDIILRDINVIKENAGRAGTLYTITGYDVNNKKSSFQISSGIYDAIKGNTKVNIKIIYYEKSRVIYNIYSFE